MTAMNTGRARTGSRKERGVALILVAILVVLLFGMAALAVDGSHIYEIRTQVQATVDAAALAAAKQLPDQTAARAAAIDAATKNMDPSVHGTVVQPGDVEFGKWDFNTKTFVVTGSSSSINSVRVTVSRTVANNNPINLTIAKSMGFTTADVSRKAVAAYSASKPWDIAVLEDVTGSFVQELPQAKIADQNLLDCFATSAAPTSLFGVVEFTGWSKVLSTMKPIGTSYNSLKSAITGINSCNTSGAPVCSGTDIAAGLQATVNMVAASSSGVGVSKAIVLVSDGQPEPNANGSHPGFSAAQLKTLATTWANNANAAGISLFVVYYDGDNDPVAKAFMQTLIRGEGVFLSTPDPTKIPDLLNTVCGKLIKLHLVH